MKIAFLSGAYINAGDYLIEKRAIDLLHYVFPNAEVTVYLRNRISENMIGINNADCVVFGGGPIYMNNLDGYIPLKQCIEEIKKPIYIIGGGWYGQSGGNAHIHNYKFSQLTLEFLKCVEKNNGLSCRDMLTYQVLKEAGLKNICVTGCPAWYDLEHINTTECNGNTPFKKIVISDPAQKMNFDNCVKVVKALVKKYPKAKKVFVFHRGVDSNSIFYKRINDLGIEILDISGAKEGFQIYDDCDLHVGYRVHAHIYNLSIRNKSILIEEDGRGAGVNQILGLPSIKAYNDSFLSSNITIHKIYKRSSMYNNNNTANELNTYLKMLNDSDYQYLRNAYTLQKSFFNNMISFIQSINK